ncbi:cathepsin 8-like isoform X2 [Diachasmimorpha longicaudata]|uniref:cathepsin 8-like isoform X2 n=1 Tax=Diachasmimorpha longicaudata TaxID=58733 RepID=UPI0030B86C82
MRFIKCTILFLFIPMISIQGQSFLDNIRKLPEKISEKFNEYWHFYKANFDKAYKGKEEHRRRRIWERSLLKIYHHNLEAAAGHHTYTLRDNDIADLSSREYHKALVKLLPSRKRRISDDEIVGAVHHDPRSIPTHLDWRKLGFKTKPVNQRDCGSCYAYSIAESIAGQIFKKTGLVIPLSAQQLVDCSTITGNLGCAGGSLRNTMKYFERVGGLMAQVNYPYKARESSCKYNGDLSAANVSSWAILPAQDERALEAAVATIGPIATSINASPKTFQLYQILLCHEMNFFRKFCTRTTLD